MQHWLPYDEERLLRLLRVDRETLWRHLRDDRRTIAQLAAGRGWPDPERLAAALVAEPRGRVPLDELRSRALRTLTQGHLSQHILFHSLHQDAVPDDARATFGVHSTDELQRLRRLDIGPLQVARMNGLSRAHVERSARRALRERAAEGVRDGALSPRQARLLLARQLRQLPRWLSESHYNGPPRTDRTGRLQRAPGPRVGGTRDQRGRLARRRRGVRAEAVARLAARRDQRRVVDGRGGRRGGQPRASGARGPPVFRLQPRPLRRRAPRRLRDLGRQPQLRQALWRHLDRPGRPGGRSSATGGERTRGHRPDRLRTRDLG